MLVKLRGFAVLWVGIATICAAQPAPEPASDTDEIVVTGTHKPFVLDGDRLRDSQAAFDLGREAFSPGSVLQFEIRPAGRQPLPATIRLSLLAGDDETAIIVNPDRRFGIPAFPRKGKLALRGSLKGVPVRVLPYVRSPGRDDGRMRLGDLRLECRAIWAMESRNAPFLLKAVFTAAVGACTSRKIAIWFPVRQRLAEAASTDGASASKDIPLSADRLAFRPPIDDEAINNSASVKIRYQ